MLQLQLGLGAVDRRISNRLEHVDVDNYCFTISLVGPSERCSAQTTPTICYPTASTFMPLPAANDARAQLLLAIGTEESLFIQLTNNFN